MGRPVPRASQTESGGQVGEPWCRGVAVETKRVGEQDRVQGTVVRPPLRAQRV